MSRLASWLIAHGDAARCSLRAEHWAVFNIYHSELKRNQASSADRPSLSVCSLMLSQRACCTATPAHMACSSATASRRRPCGCVTPRNKRNAFARREKIAKLCVPFWQSAQRTYDGATGKVGLLCCESEDLGTGEAASSTVHRAVTPGCTLYSLLTLQHGRVQPDFTLTPC